ncbi:glycosyltransferase family 4 protein [Methanosarcina sp.]|uniref:glycosyltransferase family 4 protein n=1 Tax=Methanosarcina sp. TaxID=2213 RepID=UPI003C77E68D
MKNVVFVRSSSKPARVEKEAESLKNAGYSVRILYWDRNSNQSRVESKNGINIKYFGLKAPYGKLSLIPYLLIWWIYELFFLLRSESETIHSCCFDTLIPAILTKTIQKKKIVYDIFDFYAESLPENIPPSIRNIVSSFEKFCIRFVDFVIIVDNSRYIQIKEAKIQKMDVIMNCPNDIIVNPKSSPNTEFIIFYGGMISKTRGLMELINSIRDLDNIKFIIAGMGEDENLFKEISSKTKNVTYLGWINYEKYIDFTLSADLIFGFYDPKIPNNRLASPNKLFEAMMCSTPIIVNEETSMAEIVKQDNCGLIVPYSNHNLLKKSILKLKDNPELCLKMGENGRKAFEREYNWQVMSRKLIESYNNI